MECIFCRIINKELPSRTLYEDELLLVIMDAFPQVDGHVLVIPKKHYETFLEIDDKLLIHINKVVKEIGTLLISKLAAKSLTLVVNYGDRQEIKHYHLHLLPDHLKNKGKENVSEVFTKLKN